MTERLHTFSFEEVVLPSTEMISMRTKLRMSRLMF